MSRSHGLKNRRFESQFEITRQVAAIKSLRFAFFVMKVSPNICYLTQLRAPWKYSLIHFQQYQPTRISHHFYRYRMSLKHFLHDKKFIIAIKETHAEIKLIYFVNKWNADIIDVGFIKIWSIFFLTFYLWIWRLHLTCSTLVWGSLDVSIFR